MRAAAWALSVLTFLSISCANSEKESQPSKSQAKANSEIEFDRKLWLATDGADFPYREKMVADLFKDDKLKGLTKEQIVEKLGAPTRTDKNYIFYLISQKRIQFFPISTKTLVIRLSPEGLSEAVLIHGG